MITCSIEGDVLNMGYVIARESVSSSFKVKHAAGPRSLPGLLGRGSALGGVGEPSQELPPPLPSAGDGRLRRPVPPPQASQGRWSLCLRAFAWPSRRAGRSSTQAPFVEDAVHRRSHCPADCHSHAGRQAWLPAPPHVWGARAPGIQPSTGPLLPSPAEVGGWVQTRAAGRCFVEEGGSQEQRAKGREEGERMLLVQRKAAVALGVALEDRGHDELRPGGRTARLGAPA